MSATRGNVIETRDLTVRFRKDEVLRGLTTAFERGTVTALLGRNGVGKSTLLRVLVGFLPATSGEASVFGLPCSKRGPDIRRRVGYVPDRLELPRWMSVDDHLRFLEAFYPTWDKHEERRLLAQLDLDAKAKVKDLSKGQREKHALVAALAHRPDLLLLDEPFSGLDPVVRQEVLTAVLGHLRDDGRTILVVTHSMQDVERIADRIVLIEDGRVRMDGASEDLRRRMRRVGVTLHRDAPPSWTPPGSPRTERRGDDVVLSYLEWDDAHEARLDADPAVRDWRQLSTGIEDLFRLATASEGATLSPTTTAQKESEPCAAS